MTTPAKSKLCDCCCVRQPRSEFYVDKTSPDGIRRNCKECVKARVRAQLTVKKLDAEWVSKERVRCRVKRRLAYAAGKTKPTPREKLREVQRSCRAKYPQKDRARWMLGKAVKNGAVVKPESCTECGRSSGRICGHHDDYSKPLDVRWLCDKCHGEKHITTEQHQ